MGIKLNNPCEMLRKMTSTSEHPIITVIVVF